MSITTDQKDNIIRSSGDGFTVAVGDSLIVEPGILISTPSTWGANLLGNNHLVLKGIVAAQVAIEAQSGGSIIDIESTGVAAGTAWGVTLGSGDILNNHGSITGNSDGVLSIGTDFTINNFGTIQNGTAGGPAISLGGPASSTHIITNSGSIIDRNPAPTSFAISTGAASEHITNTGTIKGAISLGAGNDRYDGHLGHHFTGSIDGGAGNDVIKGGVEGDVIIGNTGDDYISGGKGNDNLTGGADKDTFVFNTTLGSIDTITDFSHIDDTIKLENAIFTALGAAGALASTRFYAAAAAAHGHDSDDRIVYNTTNGFLYYDSDGSGSHAAVHFATLTTHPTIHVSDFVVI